MFLLIYLAVGLILGPSCLKFSTNDTLVNIAACGFLFVAGIEIPLRSVRASFGKSGKLALGAFLVPFAVGWMVWPGQIVLSLAMAISALPVIVQILKELQIYHKPISYSILGAATLCDIAAWMIFLWILPSEGRGSWLLSHGAVAFFFIGLFLGEFFGEHRPHSGRFKKIMVKASKWMFAPVFFIGVGMKINLQDSFDVVQMIQVFIVASVGKVSGAYVAARWAALTHQQSLLAATVLNARGAMEVLYATLALQIGLIDRTFFTSLIFMALLSSVIAAPIARRWRFDERPGPEFGY